MKRATAAAKWLALSALMTLWVSGSGAQTPTAQSPETPPAHNLSPKKQKRPVSAPSANAASDQSSSKAQRPASKGKAAPVAKSENQPEVKEAALHRRDPFEPLVNKKIAESGPANLPPGKAGLLISSVNIDGCVRGPNGMIAVVSNPQRRTYFLREGDRVYDGSVEKIQLDGVTFRQIAKDAFGKEVQRLVTKRLYPSSGEQQ